MSLEYRKRFAHILSDAISRLYSHPASPPPPARTQTPIPPVPQPDLFSLRPLIYFSSGLDTSDLKTPNQEERLRAPRASEEATRPSANGGRPVRSVPILHTASAKSPNQLSFLGAFRKVHRHTFSSAK